MRTRRVLVPAGFSAIVAGMGSMTAQILIGSDNYFHGGIYGHHALFLSENSRPGLILTPLIFRQGNHPRIPPPVPIWIPTADHILEDALLMLALHVVRSPELMAQAESLFRRDWRGRLELSRDIDPAGLVALRNSCRGLHLPHEAEKLIVTVMEGSSITDSLGVLDNYPWGFELCVASRTTPVPSRGP